MLTSILQMGGSTTNYFFLRFSDVPLSIFHSPPSHPAKNRLMAQLSGNFAESCRVVMQGGPFCGWIDVCFA